MRWIKNYRTSTATQAASTKRQYRECWKQLAKVFEHGIAAGIRPADVARYLRVERTTTAAIARTGCARLWRG